MASAMIHSAASLTLESSFQGTDYRSISKHVDIAWCREGILLRFVFG